MYIFSCKNLKGKITLPPSKSILHRYIIASSISGENIILNGVNQLCDDITTTMNIMRHTFGADFYIKEDSLFVSYKPISKLNNNIFLFDDSATTLRLCFPLLLYKFKYIYIFTNKSLENRTIWSYINLLNIKEFKSLTKNSEFPMYIRGDLLSSDYILEENISSQFLSGLFFSLPLLNQDSTLRLKKPIPSVNYVKLTLKVLKDFNITIEYNRNFDFFNIPGKQKYKGLFKKFVIEEDLSSRSYWEVCNIINKKNNIILNPIKRSLQPDVSFISKIYKNCSIIDIQNMPDCAILCCFYLMNMHKKGIIKGIKRLKYKESDRLNSIIDILIKSSISYSLEEDYLIIKKGSFKSGYYNTFFDHRVTMALIIATSFSKNIVVKLKEINSINKSYPNFLKDFLKLGGSITNG